MWLDENAPATEQNKVFASKIVVTTGQVELIKTLADEVEIGDYISMTPTATSYTPPSSITGYTGSSQQTLNPSELNLWRVIKKNDDGTVDMVSDKVSSTLVYFRGKTGYLNFVGGLNTIATQYTDGKHVARTRHMGYSNQIETCTALSSSACPSDTGYQTDLELVNVAYGGTASCTSSCTALIGKNPSGTANAYWLASRYIINGSPVYYYGRYVDTSGSLSYGSLVNSSDAEDYFSRTVRPIVTLKSNIKIASGDGRSESTAYTLE